jgi:beta-glucosidase
MGRMRVLRFPKGFLWGTASAAYQCEGGHTNNQWYRWEQQGHILSGEHCGDACKWWQGGAEGDFEFAEQMENSALRLSLEWSRIEPHAGQWDSAAVERYRAMLQDLRRRRIKPVITLHHFTDPLWFTERGGFTNAANIALFVRYVSRIVTELRDLCDFWITINEPNIYAVEGYLHGVFPPGEHDLVQTLHVLRNLVQAHVEAFYAIRHIQPQAQIGYCLHYRLFDPLNKFSLLDHSAAVMQRNFFNWATLRAGETGRFPLLARTLLSSIPRAAGARDYHGVSYYTREMVRFDKSMPTHAFGQRFMHPAAIQNDPGLDASFGEIYPEGIYRVLSAVYQRTHGNKPLYITANGFSDALDDRRPAAILEHLAMVHRAIREGVPVQGYFYRTLVDNFEWHNGWHVRFGLIELDPLTQRRIPRRSASLFGEICRANAITESIVERYAPECASSIFGLIKPHQLWIAV